MKKQYLKIILIGLIGVVCSFSNMAIAGKPKAIVLKLNLVPGALYEYETLAQMENTYVADGAEQQSSSVKQCTTHSVKCLEKTEGGLFLLKIRYSEYEVEMRGMREGKQILSIMDAKGLRYFEDEELQYDLPWNEVPEHMMSSIPELLRTDFLLKLDERNQIVDFGNVEELQERFADINLKQLLTPTVIFPVNELSVGAQWSDEKDIQLPLIASSPISGKTLKNKYRYELNRIKKKKGRFLAEIVVNVNSLVTDLAKAAGHVSQESKGQVWFDSDDGMIRSMEMFTEQKLELQIQNKQIQGRNTNQVEQKLLTVKFPQASTDTGTDK